MIDDSNDENRTYIITAKFKVSGTLPHFISKEHIESNIQAAIERAAGEIELSSEYYDMKEDIVWAAFLQGDVQMETKEIKVDICAEPFCEHCGERHTDFGVEVYEDGITWCLNCFLQGNDDVFSKEEISEIQSNTKTLKIKHYKDILKDLEDGEA
jgi:hypothetical protein